MSKGKAKPIEPEVGLIMDAIKAKMIARGEGAKDVARYIGKGYQWTWEVINKRKGTPRGGNLVLLQTYLSLDDKASTFAK